MATKHGTAWTHWPRFEPGQKLAAEALNQILADHAARTALLNRALHGAGVIAGFNVAVVAGDHCVLTISCGTALDKFGRVLHWRGDAPVCRDHLAGDPPTGNGKYTLLVHYAELRPGYDPCDPCMRKTAWVEQGVVFSLREGWKEPQAACPNIPDDACISLENYICLRTGAHGGAVPIADDLALLCAEPGELCPIGCDWWYDGRTGIPLARIEVREFQPGDPPCYLFGNAIDNCAERPFVHRSPLLAELNRGCHLDLPRIASTNWTEWFTQGWTRDVKWADFSPRFFPGNSFQIEFTKPIKVATLTPAAIFFTAFTREKDADYWIPQIVPAWVLPHGEVGGLATKFEFKFNDQWVKNELGEVQSTLSEKSRWQLTVRGQMVRDNCGNMLDARLEGYFPTGWDQARPGGDYIALARIQAKPKAKPKREPKITPQSRPETSYPE